jgi:O-antigen/teichoic acid export membrane protein
VFVRSGNGHFTQYELERKRLKMSVDLKTLLTHSQLKQNILSGVLAAGLQAVSNLVAYPVYIHYLDYELYGTWLILATFITLMQLGIAGIGPAISQLVAEAYARHDHHKLRGYVTWTAILVTAVTLLLTVLSWVMKPLIASLLSLPGSAQASISLIPLVALVSGYFLWVEIFASVLSGLGRIDQTNFISALGQGLIVFIAFLFLRQGWGIVSLIIGYFTGRGAVNIVIVLLIRRRYSQPLFAGRDLAAAELTTLLRVAGSLLAGTVLNFFVNPFNKWIIAVNLGVSQVPIYEIAFGASIQVRNFFEFGLRSLVPEISRANAAGSTEARTRIRSVFRKGLFVSTLVGVPLYLIVGILAQQIFELWLHGSLRSSQAGAFRILLVGSFVSMVAMSAYYCLIGLQAVRSLFQSYVIQVGLNVLLISSLLLLHQVNVFWVCAATSASIVSASLYLIGSSFLMLKHLSSESSRGCEAAQVI